MSYKYSKTQSAGQYYEYEYNNYGLLTKERCVDNTSGNIIYDHTYEYDSHKNKIKEVSVQSSGSSRTTVYQNFYNSKNQLIKVRNFSGYTSIPSDGKGYDSETTITYYNNGIIKQQDTTSNLNSSSNQIKSYNKYDEHGNIIEYISGYDDYVYSYKYTYDSNNRKVKAVWSNGKNTTIEYTYDEKGREIKRYSNVYSYEEFFDSYGNLVEEQKFENASGKTSLYETTRYAWKEIN